MWSTWKLQNGKGVWLCEVFLAVKNYLTSKDMCLSRRILVEISAHHLKLKYMGSRAIPTKRVEYYLLSDMSLGFINCSFRRMINKLLPYPSTYMVRRRRDDADIVINLELFKILKSMNLKNKINFLYYYIYNSHTIIQ